MKPRLDYTLYVITDRTIMSSPTIEDSVTQAILGGCTIVQLREKNISSKEFFETAKRVREVTILYNIPLIINDRVDIALAVDADGVHIGKNDLPANKVRSIIGPHKIMGVSASNLTEALSAQKAGADYLGIGAMYETDTKTDAKIITLPELKCIRDAITLPLVVIGGINKKTIPNFVNTGIDGLAIASAIISQKDVKKAARELKDLFIC